MMKITLNREDLKGDYTDLNDCPIYRALKRKGYDLERVGAQSIYLNNGLSYHIKNSFKVCCNITEAQEQGLGSVEVEIEGLD